MGQHLAAMWRGCLGCAISPWLAADEDTFRQATRIVAFNLAMLLWVPVYAVIYAALDAPLSSQVVIGAGVGFVSLLGALRLGVSVAIVGNLLCAVCWLTYTLLALTNGGANAPPMMWYPSIPLISLWICGTRTGMVWTAISLAAISMFFAAREFSIAIPNELTPAALQFLEWSGLLGIVGCVFVLVVVLKRVEAATRESLALALQHAKAADRAKSEFLANMSHEIRTPMTAILGYADILAAGEDCENSAVSRDEALETIRRNGSHLLQVIGDILDLSKIEVGKFMLEEVPCSPLDTIRDVVRLMRLRAKAKHLRLSLAFEGPIPATIHTDPLRFRQILLNLLGNAIKFTEFGGVRVRVKLLPVAGRTLVECVIADSGIGIPNGQTAVLFQPFTQGDMSTARRHGGTGLGLAISKRLAIMLGGDLTVESQPDVGSTFRVTIDPGPLDGTEMITIDGDQLQAGERAEPRLKPAATVQLHCRVLLAEDGPDNRRLISFVLEKAGAEVVTVEDGRAAVERALAARDAGTPFDVLLVDIQMPHVDGYEATARLRAAGYHHPIIALTAHAMRGDRERCLAAGCDDYATKPIDRHALVRLVAEHTGGLPAGEGLENARSAAE
jgi:signal transduction histidine kinase/ActR/RegA family two-component response regulator